VLLIYLPDSELTAPYRRKFNVIAFSDAMQRGDLRGNGNGKAFARLSDLSFNSHIYTPEYENRYVFK